MDKYNVENISRIVKGTIIQQVSDLPVRHLLSDSRKLLYPESTLFIPIVSERRNGHDYIPELYKKGVRHFMISDDIAVAAFPEANFIRVKNTLQALHALAAFHRQEFNIPVIGITGSNGKTIVK